jgi:hypothetical protein
MSMSDEVKENEAGRACRSREKCTRFWWEKSMEGDGSEDQDTNQSGS